MIPIIALYAQELGASMPWIGLIISIFYLVSLTTRVPFVILADMVCRKRVLFFSLVISFISSLIYFFARTPLQLLVLRVIQGLGFSMFTPVSIALISDIASSSKRTSSVGLYAVVIAIGMSLGPAFSSLAVYTIGLRNSFIVSSLFALVGLLFGFPFSKRSSENPRSERNVKGDIINLLKNRNILGSSFSLFAFAFPYSVLTSFLHIYAYTRLMISTSTVSLLSGMGEESPHALHGG